MKKKLDDVTIIAILMVAVIIMGCMMFSSPKNDKIKRIALTATTTSITTTSTTVTTTTTTNTIATSKITTTNTSTTMTSTTTTTTTTDDTTTTSRTTTTNISTTTLADTTTVTTTTTSPVESTTDTYEATVIYKEEQPEPIELFDQELYYEPIEMIEETTIEDKDIYYFYEGSMRVHTPSCIYADPSCMEVIENGYIDYARKCTECNPDIEIGTIYEEPIIEEDNDDTYYEESDSLTRNWTVDEMTYYSGPYGCYGAAGRTLINNYSVACNSIPLGTIVYIQSSDGSVDGYYRVDDTGGMGNNVIDIFYSDYSYTPYSFRQAGRVSCTVWIVE